VAVVTTPVYQELDIELIGAYRTINDAKVSVLAYHTYLKAMRSENNEILEHEAEGDAGPGKKKQTFW
jgi:hypothetical protein